MKNNNLIKQDALHQKTHNPHKHINECPPILGKKIHEIKVDVEKYRKSNAIVMSILSAILIGLIALSRYKKAKFNGSKTQINLENPIKTVILNYGMIGFIVFFIIQIITQIIR